MRALRLVSIAAAGTAALVTLLYPQRGDHGYGTGSDERGDYDYRYEQLRLGGWTLQFGWWPERETH